MLRQTLLGSTKKPKRMYRAFRSSLAGSNIVQRK